MSKEITDEQIRELRVEAAQAGDDLTVALCDIAMATGLGETAEIDEEHRSSLERMGIIPEHVGADVIARTACARVISDAAAQAD